MSLLETRALSKDYGGHQVLRGVDFKLEQGEIRALIGPNGAGKTTFVSLIAGRVAPSSGSILFDGQDITTLPPHLRVRRGIAYTFQITSIYPALSVLANVELAAANRKDARAALQQVGLGDRAEQQAGHMAYGHQRLLEIAMGLALKPKLLILDEPTQGLSDSEILTFIDLMRALAKSTTLLLIEHNMSVVMALATSISVLANGALIAEGSPEAIRVNRIVQDAYLGNAHVAD
jgi:branched-chain amino acid transport system ATP-binding protein